jgi:hypothetical protein
MSRTAVLAVACLIAAVTCAGLSLLRADRFDPDAADAISQARERLERAGYRLVAASRIDGDWGTFYVLRPGDARAMDDLDPILTGRLRGAVLVGRGGHVSFAGEPSGFPGVSFSGVSFGGDLELVRELLPVLGLSPPRTPE